MGPLPPLSPARARQKSRSINSIRGDSIGSNALSNLANAFLGTLHMQKTSSKSSHALRSSKSGGKVYADNRSPSRRSKRTSGRSADKDGPEEDVKPRKVSIRNLANLIDVQGGGLTGLNNGKASPPLLGTLPSRDTLQGSMRNIAATLLGSAPPQQASPSKLTMTKRSQRRDEIDDDVDDDFDDDLYDDEEEENEDDPAAQRRRQIAAAEQDEVAYFSQRSGSFNVKLSHRFVLHPHGRARSVWDVFLLVLITWILFSTPFELAFRELGADTRQLIFRLDYLLDVMFAIDICTNFMTAVEYDGKLHFSYKSISRHYLTGWFLIDVLWTVPFYAMVGDASGATLPEYMAFSDLFQSNPYPALRVFRLGRIMSISRIRRRLEYSLRISSSSSSLGGFLYMVLGLSHLLSCMFAFLAFGDEQHLETALGDGSLYDDSIHSKYISASYWSMMTIATVGYGDVTVKSNSGRMFSIVAMITGAGIFAYGISNVVDLFQQLYVKETEHRHKMDQVNNLMHDRNLPRKLQDEIRANFFHLRKATQENKSQDFAIVHQMSRTMQSRVADLFCLDMMPHKMPMVAGCNAEFIHALYLAMEVQCYLPGEDIIRQDDYGTEMYFLFVGHVQVFVGHSKVAMFGPNSCFGEFAIMNPKKPRLATIQALDFCETHCLERQQLLKLLMDHPFMLHSIKQLVNLKRRKALAILTDQTTKSRTLIQSLAAVWYNEGFQALVPKGVSLDEMPHLHEFTTPVPLSAAARLASVRTGLALRRRSVTPAMGFEHALGPLVGGGEGGMLHSNGSSVHPSSVDKLRRKPSSQELDGSADGQGGAAASTANSVAQPTSTSNGGAPARLRRGTTRFAADPASESNSAGSDDRIGLILHQMNVMLKRQEQLEFQVQQLVAARHRGSVGTPVLPPVMSPTGDLRFRSWHTDLAKGDAHEAPV